MRAVRTERGWGVAPLPNVSRAGLVLHLHGPGSGFTIRDVGPYQYYDGQLKPGALWTMGREGLRYAIQLDGAAGHLLYPNVPQLSGVGALTVALWIQRIANTSLQHIATQQDETGGSHGWAVQLGGGGVGTTSDLLLVMVDAGGTAIARTSSARIKLGTWVHAAAVFDGAGTGNAGRVRLYVGGQPQAVSFSGTVPGMAPASAHNLAIGRPSPGDAYLGAIVDDVRIYSRALSGAEIVALADPSIRPPAPATRRSWALAMAAPLPAALTPGAVSLVSVASSQVSLRWSDATGGTAPRTAQLQQSADGVTWSSLGPSGGTSYTDTSVSGPQRKLYRVAYTDAASVTVYSDPLTVDVPVVAVCWINDARVEDLGLEVEDLSGYNDGTAPSFGTLSFPGMVGGYATGPGTTDARVVRLAAYLTPASLAEQEAALDTVADALQGVLELRFGDAPDKVLLGIAGKPAWQPLGVGMVDGEGIVTVDITCADPTKRSRYPTSVSFGSVRKPLPVGTLSSVGLLQVMGPATNPVVTIRGANGEVSSQLGFTATLTNAEYLEVDLGRKTVAKVTSGTRAGALASWDGSTDFFALDPGDADRAAGSYATAECSGGGTAILHYFLRYSS